MDPVEQIAQQQAQLLQQQQHMANQDQQIQQLTQQLAALAAQVANLPPAAPPPPAQQAPVAQPGRAPLCEVGGCGFESRRKGPAQVQTTRQAGQGKYG